MWRRVVDTNNKVSCSKKDHSKSPAVVVAGGELRAHTLVYPAQSGRTTPSQHLACTDQTTDCGLSASLSLYPWPISLSALVIYFSLGPFHNLGDGY